MDNGSLRRGKRQAESREATARAHDARAQRPLQALGEKDLVEAMRRHQTAALDEFLIRFNKLLFDRARAAGIHSLDCEDCITELLEEVAEAILLGRLKQIRSLSAFWCELSETVTRMSQSRVRAERPMSRSVTMVAGIRRRLASMEARSIHDR